MKANAEELRALATGLQGDLTEIDEELARLRGVLARVGGEWKDANYQHLTEMFDEVGQEMRRIRDGLSESIPGLQKRAEIVEQFNGLSSGSGGTPSPARQVPPPAAPPVEVRPADTPTFFPQTCDLFRTEIDSGFGAKFAPALGIEDTPIELRLGVEVSYRNDVKQVCFCMAYGEKQTVQAAMDLRDEEIEPWVRKTCNGRWWRCGGWHDYWQARLKQLEMIRADDFEDEKARYERLRKGNYR